MAEIDIHSAAGQAKEANLTFSEFFEKIRQAYESGGGFPEFSDMIDRLDYAEMHRISLLMQTANANHPDAAAVENIHHIEAVSREYNMCLKGKTDCYVDAQVEAAIEADFYSAMEMFYVNMIQGIYVPGETS